MSGEATTSFGASTSSAPAAAAVLRARASRHGITLHPVDDVGDVKLAAAVLAADALVAATGISDLDALARHSQMAAAAYQRILFHAAAGHVGMDADDSVPVAGTDPALLVERHAGRWEALAGKLAGDRAADALRLAALIVAGGHISGIVVDVAGVLDAVADAVDFAG